MNEALYKMLEAMAIAEIAKAKMSLELLGKHAVGIGDHSTNDFYNNADEALSRLTEAEDKLDCLTKNYAPKVRV
jgi:hypothetical protein